MKTLSQLKQSRAEFNSKIWDDYNALRKSHQQKLSAAKQEQETALAKLQKSFIRKAIKQAGTAELSDNIVIRDSRFELYKEVLIATESYHAQALLRSDLHIEHNVLLELAELFLGEDMPQPDTAELDKLEKEWSPINRFKNVLRGKDEYGDEIVLDKSRSPYGSPVMTAVELAEHVERVYPDKKVETMSTKEAMKIMEGYQKGNINNFMNTEEMAKHIASHSGVVFPEDTENMGHFGDDS